MDIDATANLDGFDYRIHNVHENGDTYDTLLAHVICAAQGCVPLIPTAEIAVNTMLNYEVVYLSQKLGSEVTAAEVIETSVNTSQEVF